jgi:L-asparagine oxygenase
MFSTDHHNIFASKCLQNEGQGDLSSNCGPASHFAVERHHLYTTFSQLNMNIDGVRLYRAFEAQRSSIEVAHGLGRPVELSAFDRRSQQPMVQQLKPHRIEDSRPTQYSGHFGLGEFPLHSDLAHWAIPPRYLLLRCVRGASSVTTNILPWMAIVDLLGRTTLTKAVFAVRTSRPFHSGLVRALSTHQNTSVLRWDSIFLKPMSQGAIALSQVMSAKAWDDVTIKFVLEEPGDMLLIDNWSVLHGRSAVKPSDTHRCIERTYLSEIF